MKISEFLNIISKYFYSEFEPDEKTGKVTAENRYSTMLQWFVVDPSDESLDGVFIKTSLAGKILNENSKEDIPIKDAKALLPKLDYKAFDEILETVELTDDSERSLIKDFKDKGHQVRKSHLAEDITNILKEILQERKNKNRLGSIRYATFLPDGTFRCGKKVIKLPDQLTPPDVPDPIESPYIEALLRVYAQKEKKPSISLDELENYSSIYQKEIQLHRDAFYSAESVLHQVRDFFTDGETEFNAMKNEVYDGIKGTLYKEYKNAYERLGKTMDVVITISFRKSYFSSDGNGLIGPNEEKGMVHILVNEGKVEWIQDYDTDI